MIINGKSPERVNISSEEILSIIQLVSVIQEKDGIMRDRKYKLSAPQGVRSRTRDHSIMFKVHNCVLATRLVSGILKTFQWIGREGEWKVRNLLEFRLVK